MKLRLNTPNVWLGIAWLTALVATMGSLYLSEVWHFVPCELCWYQRIFMYPLVVILGIASYRQQTVMVPYVLPVVAIGGCISIYHIIIQKLPKNSDIAACGVGDVSCQDDYLYWFGWITIPMLALAAFVIIAISLMQARRLGRGNEDTLESEA